ncbi:metalloendopeptidase [Plakobranchus ocellatus]|uniref:Metalloendopeptidase n=1 Tax=Plakobranchus ocellatus TaxID=259542 RepID=A0AAV3ZIE5_9GAST|nr:metalloendopeptidase [Plakobranchus ocellatus]
MQRMLQPYAPMALIMLVSAVCHEACSTMAPPPGLGRPFEKPENRSMDDLITSMLGGVGVASNLILADNGHILAELDMYLTEKQFLGMYEPPKPEDMVKMGMMPAPLGMPQADDGNYFFDFTEDYKGVRTKRKATRDVRLRWTDAIFPYTFAKGHFGISLQ